MPTPTPAPNGSVTLDANRAAVAAFVFGMTAAAAFLVCAATALFPLAEPITLRIEQVGIDGRVAGLMFWTVLGLVTSARGSAVAGSMRLTLGDGPLLAAAVLGGPAAAAWVALVGSTEVRELRGDIPWYGSLGNHATIVIAWTIGSLVYWLPGQVLGGYPPLGGLAAALAAAAVSLVLNGLLASATLVLRTGNRIQGQHLLGGGDAVLVLGAQACLAWLVAQAYVLIAWWTPLLLVVADLVAEGSLGRSRSAWIARHHPISELPNAVALEEQAADLRRSRAAGLGVFYIDLDGFKAVNDDHGHAAGDDVLRVVGRRLESACRQGDFVAHLHGDEFVVLSTGVADDAAASEIASRLVSAIEPDIDHPEGPLRVSATVGWQIVADHEDLAAATRDADQAMARAKEAKASARGEVRRRR